MNFHFICVESNMKGIFRFSIIHIEAKCKTIEQRMYLPLNQPRLLVVQITSFYNESITVIASWAGRYQEEEVSVIIRRSW